MRFTYTAYNQMLHSLREGGYSFASYGNYRDYDKCVILRHDIDFDLDRSLELAKIEKCGGVSSTYFVLLTSDFYNIFSSRSYRTIREIADNGHDIGLHFDETSYSERERTPDVMRAAIIKEAGILSTAIDMEVKAVSMHRPGKEILEADLEIPGIVNSYSKEFFKGFKYLSDSRRRWREPVDEIIQSKEYDRLHILTHAFWYDEEEFDICDRIKAFVNTANRSRYKYVGKNLADLQSVMTESEVLG